MHSSLEAFNYKEYKVLLEALTKYVNEGHDDSMLISLLLKVQRNKMVQYEEEQSNSSIYTGGIYIGGHTSMDKKGKYAKDFDETTDEMLKEDEEEITYKPAYKKKKRKSNLVSDDIKEEDDF